MELTTSHYIQLILAIALAIPFFVGVYALPPRIAYAALVLLIPFQPIDSRYGSLNVVLTYMIFGALALRGSIRYLPLLGPALILLLAYGISFSLAPPQTWFLHAVYMITFISNFLIFYLAYNVTRDRPDWSFFANVMVVLNLFVLVYCAAQIAVPGAFSVVGVEELSIAGARPDRMVGPFAATAATAEYLVISSIVLLYGYMLDRSPGRRWLFLGLIGLNTAALLATGNRGGFAIFILGGALFLWIFRRTLGFGRIMRLFLLGTACLGVASFVVLNFTRFDVIYERLLQTELRSGIPDTRTMVWSEAWEKIVEKPVTGHGPRFRLAPREEIVVGIEQIYYPHSLPLYVLYTTGIIGLTAYVLFYIALWRRLVRPSLGTNRVAPERPLDGLPYVAFIILLIHVLSQLRIEMLRLNLADYQHFTFMILGTLLGFVAHLAATRRPRADGQL